MSVSDNLLFFLCLSDRGGAEISMIRLAQGLITQGHTVTIMAYGTMPFLPREFGFTGKLIMLKQKRTLTALLPLWALLRQDHFLTLISALTHTNMAAIIASALAFKKVSTIVTEHGSDGIIVCASSKLFKNLACLIYRRASVLVAVSHALERKWREILPPQIWIKTIYNPVIDESFSEKREAPHPWLQEKRPTILGIGRLKPEKNFSLLLRAFAKMKSSKAHLVILGEGEERAHLEKMVDDLGLKEKVLLPGFVPDVRPWLAHATLLACPSEREGFGNVIVEALAYGLPVVATECVGPAEILENGRYGRLTPLDNVKAFAQAMDEGLENKADKTALQMRAQHFTAQRCVDDYAALIDNLGAQE